MQISTFVGGIVGATSSPMLRDANTVPGGDPVSHLPLAPAPRLAPSATQPPASRKAALALFDPFSQQMIVHAKAGSAITTPDPSPPAPARDAAGGPSRAVRLLQLVLLSSVAVMVWYMLKLLQAQ